MHSIDHANCSVTKDGLGAPVTILDKKMAAGCGQEAAEGTGRQPVGSRLVEEDVLLSNNDDRSQKGGMVWRPPEYRWRLPNVC